MVMLERLIERGVVKGFFEFNELGRLDKSCCSKSKLEVIDFDKTKATIVAKNKVAQPPKSADALKILPELNCVDFIELKGFKEFIKRDKKKDFKKKVEGFKLDKKIRDSFSILQSIVEDKSIRFSLEQLEEYIHIKKNFLIVVDIEPSKDPLKDLDTSRMFLSIKKTLNNIPDSSLHNLNKPKLLSCNQIDSHYQELLNKPSETL